MSDDSEPAVHGGAGTMAGGQTVTLHLVSHASGEMVEMIARNAVAQLDDVTVNRHLWKFVRNLGLVPGILAEIARCRGIVFHSIAATDIREALDEGCLHLRVPCIFVLEPFVSKLAEYSGAPIRYRTAARDFIDEDYYQRVEAMKYTLAHDDGQAADDLDDADVILVGVSRATKTPTCMYLASRGIKAANVPVVPGVPLPDGVLKAKAPLVVGL
ncbi:MAG: kinase/pyrophosphorylase, partial [Rhodospirillales bacterium]